MIVIDGQSYWATNLGGDTWMVKRFQEPNASDDESNYVEALIHVDTQDERKAIEAAIARNSWA